MFEIFLDPQPQRFIKKAKKELRQRVWKKLDELKLNPFPSIVVFDIDKREKAYD